MAFPRGVTRHLLWLALRATLARLAPCNLIFLIQLSYLGARIRSRGVLVLHENTIVSKILFKEVE